MHNICGNNISIRGRIAKRHRMTAIDQPHLKEVAHIRFDIDVLTLILNIYSFACRQIQLQECQVENAPYYI